MKRQRFEISHFEELAPPTLQALGGEPTLARALAAVQGVRYSVSGAATATVSSVVSRRPGAGDGCDLGDFAGFDPGAIALIAVGGCGPERKVLNARFSGASAVIFVIPELADEGTGAVALSQLSLVPVVAVPQEAGHRLAAAEGLVVRLETSTFEGFRETENVIAEGPWGAAPESFVVGAHIDSVEQGPGINDNGSGMGVVLEIARGLARLERRGQLPAPLPLAPRFAFWGAEELGSLGAKHYLNTLPESELNQLRLALNFDMLGSPNFVRFVYDGDGSDTAVPGPRGSAAAEQLFLDYFERCGLPTAPMVFDGRSDLVAFRARGIAVGGLFSGAEALKTPDQAQRFGGTAHQPFDPCYHQACDDLDNVSRLGLRQLGRAAAHAVGVLVGRSSTIFPE